jgi:hypothetical protein
LIRTIVSLVLVQIPYIINIYAPYEMSIRSCRNANRATLAHSSIEEMRVGVDAEVVILSEWQC